MPRKARIDEAGALRHIIVRGIERRNIFGDNSYRNALKIYGYITFVQKVLYKYAHL